MIIYLVPNTQKLKFKSLGGKCEYKRKKDGKEKGRNHGKRRKEGKKEDTTINAMLNKLP